MKNDYFAVFQGEEYEFIDQTSYILLISENSKSVAKGFEPEDSVYTRQVQLGELDTAYRCTTYARYQDIECLITKCEKGQIRLRYTYSYRKAEEHGFIEIDRSVYEKYVSVRDIAEAWYQYEPTLGFEIQPEQRIKRIK